MKGTKLWYAPGSPLIQGRSRRERSFSADAVSGAVVGTAIALLGVGAALYTDLVMRVPAVVALSAIGSGTVGSVAGVALARAFGWHPRWVAGTMLYLVACAVVSFALLH